MRWEDVRSAWSEKWKSLQEEAVQKYGPSIEADPDRFRQVVASFIGELARSRETLDRIAALAKGLEDGALASRVRALEARYATLGAGVFADAQPESGIGAAPILIGVVVVGVVVGLAGIAWAVAAYQYAVNLREHTALLEKELTARVEASRDGRELPPSGIPAPPSPTSPVRTVGLLLLGGLTLAAAAVSVPLLAKGGSR